MARTAAELRADAEAIWWAGVRAVLPSRLVPEHVRVDGHSLVMGDDAIDLRAVRRIAIVGAGKAAGAMAVALEQTIGSRLLAEKHVAGWVNVPADCVVPTERVTLHAARPAGVNEPRVEGVEGTRRILELVASLAADDLCFCLLSGGGSALLVAPPAGVTLADKIRVTQLLSAAGADIRQLNVVRRALSDVKGGGLARACRAGRLVSLVLSDVPGDPLEIIASAPTVQAAASPHEALRALEELRLADHPDLARVVRFLRQPRSAPSPAGPMDVTNLVIGNNAMAVDAAGVEAERLGYTHVMHSAIASEGPAEDLGQHLAAMALTMREQSGPDCLITGGEPTVSLVPEAERGIGGRNQQLALAALVYLGTCERIALLSGGTDGEDGPTDAAGAVVTAEVVAQAAGLALNPRDYLRRNDAYHFFAAAGGLFMTGPTQTNVCDVRVVTVAR
jgi:hydroxypyruvate reductase